MRPLKLSFGIMYQNLTSKSFKSCKLQSEASIFLARHEKRLSEKACAPLASVKIMF